MADTLNCYGCSVCRFRVIFLVITQLPVTISAYSAKIISVIFPCKVVQFQTMGVIFSANNTCRMIVTSQRFKAFLFTGFFGFINRIHVIVSFFLLNNEAIHILERFTATGGYSVEGVRVSLENVSSAAAVSDRFSDK